MIDSPIYFIIRIRKSILCDLSYLLVYFIIKTKKSFVMKQSDIHQFILLL